MSEELPRTLSQSEMEMIEARMLQRNERLAQKCTEFGLDAHGIKYTPSQLNNLSVQFPSCYRK